MRICFRALEPEDYKLISQWRHDEEITNLLGGNLFFVSEEREKQWVAARSVTEDHGIFLAICLKQTGQMIGYTSLLNLDYRNSKMDIGGWVIGEKSLWNKGYAKESVRCLLDHVFLEYPLHKCSSFCLEEHEISIKIHKSLGFSLEGVLRDEVFKNGEYKSILVYSILRDEYNRLYSKGL